MFWRKKKHKAEKKRSKYKVTVDSENLAFPEIHIRRPNAKKDRADDIDDKSAGEEITYDNVAIPEIHIRKKRRDKRADK